LLYKFFDRYAESGWREPVQINFRKKAQNLVASHLDALDRISKDVMVVLAPIDQIKNTAYRVTDHTFQTICQELRRAKNIMIKLLPRSSFPKQKTTHNEKDLSKLLDLLEEESKEEPIVLRKPVTTSWTSLFKGFRFFPRYYHFIKIDILSHKEVENFKWVSYVETQLSRLAIQLYKLLED
jgi:poly(A) polymerase Pap1